MLQNFTSNPELLQLAVDRALRTVADAVLEKDYRDDPNSTSNFMKQSKEFITQGPMGSEIEATVNMMTAFLMKAEAEWQAQRTDQRVYLTLGALRAIARYVSGFPGRKNLIWVSSSFPLWVLPDPVNTVQPLSSSPNPFVGVQDYGQAVYKTTSLLTDIRVAIYPVSARGLETPGYFDVANTGLHGPGVGLLPDYYERDFKNRQSAKDSMVQLAEETSGKACFDTNSLDDCVLEAIRDGASYYVLGYYPSNPKWDGSFRHIKVKTTRKGVKLRYRRGYFADDKREARRKKSAQKNDLREAVVGNPWSSTAIMIVARPLLPEEPEEVLWHLAIDGQSLTFVPNGDQQILNLEIGVGIFNAYGKLLKFFQGKVRLEAASSLAAAVKKYGFPHTVAVPHHPKATRIRLAVHDVASGLIGTVDVPVEPQNTSR